MAARHILTFAQTLQGGGVERAQLRLARGWIDAGRRVTLMIGSSAGPLATELPPGLEIVDLGSAAYSALYQLPLHVRRNAPDVLFCPGNHYTSVAAWTRMRLGRACPPIVAKISNALIRPDQGFAVARGYAAWLRLHPLFLDAAVAMTGGMRAEAIAAMHMPADRVTVIPNPPALPIPCAAPIRLPAGRFILGVGRLAPQKRWDRLIAAMPRLDPTVSLLILGEGAERGSLEAQVAALSLESRVAMPGHVADPLPATAHATVTVLTSDFEGVPGVLRESLALGTPVVATDSSVGVREIVDSPDLGTIVAPDDPEALIAALEYWLAPGRARPVPVQASEPDPAASYLALFDRIVDQRRR
ncbi:glycosyltransferase [soil metagenome]